MAGSWSKRGKDSYLLTVCIGTDFMGKPKRFTKTVQCNSDAKADRELAKFYTVCEAGDITKPNKMTVEAICDLWIDKYCQHKLKARTTFQRKRIYHLKLLGAHILYYITCIIPPSNGNLRTLIPAH